ncbi:MAG: hypothetical protein HYY84_03640 [Deltaproteobacteria bacterium]|nr:hypothetical protein [Deltaproteobacteria bacterium]
MMGTSAKNKTVRYSVFFLGGLVAWSISETASASNPAAPINGWPTAAAPNGRVLSLDLARINEKKLLRPGRAGALYAIAAKPSEFRADRTPLILIHGIKGDPKDLQHVLNRFKSRPVQFYAFAYDDYHRRTSLNGNDLAEQLAALSERYWGPEREVIIVAHSMGGLVARYALNQLAFGVSPRINRFKMVRLFTVDTPWHGYGGPSDRGVEGFFMKVAGAFMPDGLEDMRAESGLFQGRPNGRSAAERAGLLNLILPAHVKVNVVFAQDGKNIMDYTEGDIKDLVPKIAARFGSNTPIRGTARQINFWKALIQARTAISAFRSEMESAATAGRLTEATVRDALDRHYPRFPGDHTGVLREHPGKRSFLDHLSDQLGQP